MSWIEKINTELQIQTGDGETYSVLWTPTNAVTEYNVAEFEFAGVDGTLVNKQRVKGRKFPIEFYFQGENHLDQYKAFEESAKNPNYWVILHPYYDIIRVQPLGLEFDHSSYNITKVKGTLLETITDVNPNISFNFVDLIIYDKEVLDELVLSAGTGTINVTSLSTQNAVIYSKASGTKKTNTQFTSYFNAFKEANAAVQKASQKPIDAMRKTQALINAPALFTTSVKERFALLSSQYETLKTSIVSKKTFQIQGVTIISNICIAVINFLPTDYKTRQSVLSVYTDVLNIYNDFIKKCDELQTETGGKLDSYIPDSQSFNLLNKIVKNTISNLNQIALNAKQERIVTLQEDTNPILFTHKYIGLDNEDVNLVDLVTNNNIVLKELYNLKKGRKIIYYV